MLTWVTNSMVHQVRGYLGEAYGGVDGKRSDNFDLALEILGLKGTSTTAGIDFGFTNTYNGMIDRAPKHLHCTR